MLDADEAADEEQQEACLWPCNLPTWDLWLTVQTQWRHGMGGPTGLDYAAVRATMQLAGIRRRDRAARFAGIRAMEMAVLDVWAEKRKD